jgi:AAA family ATPase
MSTFVVRPSNASEKEAFRVKLTAASLLGLRLKPGDLCEITLDSAFQLSHADGNGVGTGRPERKYAIAWEASGTGMKDSIVQTSKALQELYGLKLGDRVVIVRSAEGLREEEVVRLVRREGVGWSEEGRRFWEYYARLTVRMIHECVAKGQVLAFKVGEEKVEFEVGDVGAEGMGIAKVGEGTKFEIHEGGEAKMHVVEFTSAGVGGLKKEVEEMRKLVSRLLTPKIARKYAPVQGVLIYGAKGVGKSHFTEVLSRSGWSSVIRWTPGTKVGTTIRPTVIIIDQLDLPSSQTASKPLLREIDRLFSQIIGTQCMVVGETRHPNDVDAYLRSEGKFAVEIEIPIPSALQRRDILAVMRSDDPTPSDDLLQQMSERTHGYVAGDLKALLRRTLELAFESEPDPPTNGILDTSEANQPSTPTPSITTTHLSLALQQIRPSALQEIFLETPNVRWTDIGGQHEIKRQLQNAVERPLKQAELMKKLSLRPKKGVLLYGPPGCSKTLLVRALATEAGLNFLAVKGAELISMYVGESERATREVFRKARAASPSIIFFDEIDAIATRNRSGGDLNVLTTLLNEMDGFEELKNVFVVAATNKPDAIDPALLRPGRFDNVVYIGPPDLEARREIFEKQFEKSSYRVASDTDMEADFLLFAGQTEGFSGAEIVAICQTAAEYALDDDRDFYDSADVEKAISRTPKSITREILEGFETWNAARMR